MGGQKLLVLVGGKLAASIGMENDRGAQKTNVGSDLVLCMQTDNGLGASRNRTKGSQDGLAMSCTPSQQEFRCPYSTRFHECLMGHTISDIKIGALAWRSASC